MGKGVSEMMITGGRGAGVWRGSQAFRGDRLFGKTGSCSPSKCFKKWGQEGWELRGGIWSGFLKLCSRLPGKAMNPTVSKPVMGEQGKGPMI